MAEYSSNSFRSRRENDNKEREVVPEKRVKAPVARGERRKKSDIAKAVATFITPDDAENIKQYIIWDVIVPLIKRGISDTVNAVLYPGGSPDRRGGSKVSYSSIYDNGRTRENTVRRDVYSYDDISFRTRGEAENILMSMEDILDRYKLVSVADLYDLAGITCSHTDYKYGWTSLSGAKVISCRDGYFIKLSRPMPIE